jgi:hypothetical protein
MADSKSDYAKLYGNALPGVGWRKPTPPPEYEDWVKARTASDLSASQGGIADPGSLLPGQPPNQYASAAEPDYGKMRQLSDESAQQAGMAAMKPVITRGNLNPQPVGDNALSAYVRAKNDSEQKLMAGQTAHEQATRDMFNKLLLLKGERTDRYADMAAGARSDAAQAEAGRAAKAENVDATNDAGIEKEHIKAKAKTDSAAIAAKIRGAQWQQTLHQKVAQHADQMGKDHAAAEHSLGLIDNTLAAYDAVEKDLPNHDNSFSKAQLWANKHGGNAVAGTANRIADFTGTLNNSEAITMLHPHLAAIARAAGDKITNTMFQNADKVSIPRDGDDLVNRRTKVSESKKQLAAWKQSILGRFPDLGQHQQAAAPAAVDPIFGGN